MKALEDIIKRYNKTALLIGNGPNLAAKIMPTWKNLLFSASDSPINFQLEGLSNTEVYDLVEKIKGGWLDFDVAVAMNLLSDDGTSLASEIASFGQTITNAALYADGNLIAGLTIVHDGGPATVTNEYDDFTLAVVPEPATMALLGLGSIVAFRRRRK